MQGSHTADEVRPHGGAPADDDRALSWYARPAGTGWMLLVTSLIAMAATIVIIVERSILAEDPGHRTSCDFNPWVSCGTIMKSWQAHTFGFPNTYIGVVAFSVLIPVAVSLFAGARFARWYWLTMNAGILAGFLFCVWLWYSAVYDIGTLCVYCMVVWAMVITQLVLITSRNVQTGLLGGSPRAARLARDLAGPAIAVLVLVVVASILMQLGLGVVGLG